MDVILMKDVDDLGRMGETVKVARGYARNYLVPRGMAVAASDGNRNLVQEHMKLEAKRDQLRKTSAQKLAAQLGELSCTITVQAGEDDRLFGSVTARDIADALQAGNVELDRRQIVLDEPIKQLGVYSVPVRLHSEVEITAKVWVVKS